MVQEKILEFIQQWNQSIYEVSKYKEDLGHLNDMYRLLQYKGYRFPSVKEDSAKVLRAGQTGLKTKEELQQEDRAAQEAVCLFQRNHG